MNTLASRLKKYRKDKKITQDELSDILGVSLGTIQHYEQGRVKSVSDSTYYAYALKMGVNEAWLKHGVGEMYADQPASGIMLDTILSIAPCAIALFDLEGRFILATDSYVKGLGVENERPLAGKHIGEVFPDLDPERLAWYLEEARQGRCPEVGQPREVLTPGGKVLWLRYKTKNWHLPGGERGGWYSIVFFGASPEDAEETQERVLGRIGDARLWNSAEELGDTPHGVSIQRQGAKPVLMDQNDAKALLERVLSTLIDWEAVAMISDHLGGRRFEHPSLKLIKKRGDDVYEVTVSVDVRRLDLQQLDQTTPRPEDPPQRRGRS